MDIATSELFTMNITFLSIEIVNMRSFFVEVYFSNKPQRDTQVFVLRAENPRKCHAFFKRISSTATQFFRSDISSRNDRMSSR